MLYIKTAYIVAIVSLLYTLNYGSGLLLRKVNPYEKIFKMLHHEPPINFGNFTKDYDKIKVQWLEQKVDHFDVNNKETYEMRYFVNDNFYRYNSPIFIFVGGEWEILPQFLKSGHFYDMARQQEAIMFYTEHRYYGESWPKSTSSPWNLSYLNVLQSLEDLKYFITYQKATRKALRDSKVVLVGGSYSGSMVSWFMTLYPQVADVGWASSAPLVAKMDFNEYMSSVMSSIQQKGASNCSRKLNEAFKSLAKAFHTNKAGSFLKRLNICQSFDSTNPLDRQALFNGLSNYFAALVQSYSSYITQFCLYFNNLDANPVEALIKYIMEIYSNSEELRVREPEEEWCLDFSYEGLKTIFLNENDLKSGTRPWFYQTCHEFGWFPITSTAANNISSTSFTNTTPMLAFGGQVPLSYFQQLCQDVFGNFNEVVAKNLGHGKNMSLSQQQLHARALAINKHFGGFTNTSKRVIFTHGSLDPWRAAGLQNGQNVLVIKDYSHVEDMGSINLNDSVEMNVAKLMVASFINRILNHN